MRGYFSCVQADTSCSVTAEKFHVKFKGALVNQHPFGSSAVISLVEGICQFSTMPDWQSDGPLIP